MTFKNCTIFILLIILTFSCRKIADDYLFDTSEQVDLAQIEKRDTLLIGIMPGAVSHFNYRGAIVGYDYELACNFARQIGAIPKFTVSESLPYLTALLAEQKIDLIASSVYLNRELKKNFEIVLQKDDAHPVLVQRINIYTLNSVVELKGKTVYVEPNTVLHTRLENLNQELGNTFTIALSPDSITAEKLIEMVANQQIDFTVAMSDVAKLYKANYKTLDVRLPIGFSMQNGWLVRRKSQNLAAKIREWETYKSTQRLFIKLDDKYLDKSPYFVQKRIKIPAGAISPYDHLFKQYAPQIGWDWRELAALAYHESRFDSAAVSWVGAAGLMQLMPRTAARFGLDSATVFIPSRNIEAGVQYIKSLNLIFRQISDNSEREKFIIASYNSGPAHVLDAMALAEKYGKNPHIWFDNVEYFLDKKSEPDFYSDPIVQHGKFNAGQTIAHVENILETYRKYLERK
jgi:membrane-bound lytic murein transglycosylase F